MAMRDAFDAAKHFSLHDIVLWTTSLRRDSDRGDAHLIKGVVQTMRSVQHELYSASVEGTAEDVAFLRTLVNLGLRSVISAVDEQPEIVLFTLEATFAVEYIVEKEPQPKDFQEFLEFNCVHNAWPFWRQHVFDTLKRASLPVPIIPLFSGKKSAKKRVRVRALSHQPAQE